MIWSTLSPYPVNPERGGAAAFYSPAAPGSRSTGTCRMNKEETPRKLQRKTPESWGQCQGPAGSRGSKAGLSSVMGEESAGLR